MRTQTTPPSSTGPSWSTSSFGSATDTSPVELAALSEHLSVCQGRHARLSTLRYVAETLHGFAAARFVTTLALVTLVIGVCLLTP